MRARDPLADARAALGRGEFQIALDLLAGLGAEASTSGGLELRAEASYGNGQLEAAIGAWEDLHSKLVHEGEHRAAARAAAMIAMYLMMDTGLMAPVRGWLRRAERLVAGDEQAPAHAMVAMVRTYERLMCGDLESTRAQATRAIDLGERLGVKPAVVIGRVAMARSEIYAGNVQLGLDSLDEVGAELMTGEVDPLTTGMMYCELICAAQGLGRFDLAREWTEVMERWRHGAAFGGIHGRCRVHRAELLRISGPCDRAEEEALAACEELRPWMRREFGWPLVELGVIRLRKGDLPGAEEAFVAAHGRAWSPHPGLALLRLEQGDLAAASSLIAHAIAHPIDIPSKERPPFGDLRLAPLHDAQAEIAHAAGDLDTLRRSASSLRDVADTYASDALRASADLALARASLLAGDLDDAIEAAGASVAGWADIGAPFESAAARAVLGEAHRRAGDAPAARMEWQAARDAFDAFGARRWVERVDRVLADLAWPERSPGAGASVVGAGAGADAGADVATFTCVGDTWTVCFHGRTVLVRDLKGLRYLARLLAEPGREFHVLDLVAVEQGTPVVEGGAGVGELDGVAGAGLPVIDEQARDAYRRRLVEVDEDIEEASSMNDVGRLELARRDRAYLVAELAGAMGLRGRLRETGSTSERARSSVARSLRYAIKRLAEHDPTLGTHLGQALRTGTYCCYSPDPLAPVVWQVVAASRL